MIFRGALGAYPDDEPDRVDIFDGQATKQESAELRVSGDHANDGLQAAGSGPEEV
jgi:hypothetical protein